MCNTNTNPFQVFSFGLVLRNYQTGCLFKITSLLFCIIDFSSVSDYISRLVLSFSRQVVQTRFLKRRTHTHKLVHFRFGLNEYMVKSLLYYSHYFSNLEIEVMSSKFKSMSTVKLHERRTPFSHYLARERQKLS